MNNSILIPSLVAAAVVVPFVLAIGYGAFRRHAIRNAPLTSRDAFGHHEFELQPDELAPVRLTAVGRGITILSVVFGIVAVGVTLATLHRLQMDHRFAQAGTDISAVVLGTSKNGHRHVVEYEFRVGNRTYRGSGDVPTLRSQMNARRSAEMSVRYLPSDPSINRPAEERDLPVAVGAIAPAMMDAFVLFLVWHLRRDYVLARIGRHTSGVVVGVMSQPHGALIFYDFLNGREQVARSKSGLSFPYVSQASVGSRVEVLYLPDEPERNGLKLSLCWVKGPAP
jgi:hypothetical protein